MHRRNFVLGISVLCALAFSAVVAASASAEQRAYTCTESATKAFSDAHCINPGGTPKYGHALIPVGETTEISGTNLRTAAETTSHQPSKLKGALSGVETELQCTTLKGMGSLKNAAASVSGTGVIEYTECVVEKPAGKGCVVKGGTVTTKELAATTAGQAANKVKFTPAVGTEFASITIEKCTIAALNNTFPVVGSLIATASGATLTTTHADTTTQNTLKFGGVKAGLEGALTIGMKTPVADNEAITLT